MKKLDRYIGMTVLIAMLSVMLIVVFLDTLFAFMAQLEAVRNDYQLPQVVQYIILTTPKRIYEIIPVASLIGCLLGLGSLANHSELVIIRAAGISLRRISWYVIKPAIVLMVLGLLIGEFVAPVAGQTADSMKKMARSAYASSVDEGLWYREGDSYMYLDVFNSDGILNGLSIYTFDDRKYLKQTVYAKRAVTKGEYWLMEDVEISNYSDDTVESLHKDRQVWQTGLTTELLQVMSANPEDLSMQGLVTYIDYLDNEGFESGEYRLVLYKKLLQPLAIFALVLIGISFVFGPLRSVSMGLRLFSGVATGVIFMIIKNLMGPASLVFGFPPLLAVMMPILLCLGIGVGLLKRAG